MTGIPFIDLMNAELSEARKNWPDMVDAHHGYAKIKEEFDEFWDEVRIKESRRSADRMLHELVQLAAMARRTAEDLKLVRRP